MAKQPHTLSRAAAQRFYDRLGIGHDRAEWYEGRAKLRGLELLDLAPGQHCLNLGVGTGKEHLLIQETVRPGGRLYGLDYSPVMLAIARRRSGAPLVRADVLAIPFRAGAFDRIYSSYLLDLIGAADLPPLLTRIGQLLRPNGRAVIVSLGEGVDPLSRTVIGLWKFAYWLNPIFCGGCRPLALGPLAATAGLRLVQREVVVQAGMPSEVLVLARA